MKTKKKKLVYSGVYSQKANDYTLIESPFFFLKDSLAKNSYKQLYNKK